MKENDVKNRENDVNDQVDNGANNTDNQPPKKRRHKKTFFGTIKRGLRKGRKKAGRLAKKAVPLIGAFALGAGAMGGAAVAYAYKQKDNVPNEEPEYTDEEEETQTYDDGEQETVAE